VTFVQFDVLSREDRMYRKDVQEEMGAGGGEGGGRLRNKVAIIHNFKIFWGISVCPTLLTSARSFSSCTKLSFGWRRREGTTRPTRPD